MGKEQEEIGRLKVEIETPYLWIDNINIKDQANQHAVLDLTLTVPKMLTPEDALRLEDIKIKITDAQEDPIFVGIAQSIGIKNQADYSQIIIKAKSLSSQSDQKKYTRTFQDPGKMLSDVANSIYAPYEVQVEVAEDLEIQQILYQNSETDWQFIKRIANQHSMYLFTDSKADKMRVSIGPYPFAQKKLGEESKKTGSKKDLDKYNKIRANLDQEAQPCQYEKIYTKSYDLTIGTGYQLNREGQRTSYSVKSQIRGDKSALENQLTLAHKEGCNPTEKEITKDYNQGDYIQGTIIAVEQTNVKVHFDCDQAQETSKATWIPYENVMNNYIYAMPDIGDKIFVYYENNGKAVALGSQRSDGGASPDYSDVSAKSLTSTNKMLRFTPGSAQLVSGRGAHDKGGGNQSVILLSDEGGIQIQSTQDVVISAKSRLIMQASDEKVKALEKYAEFKAKHEAGKAKYLAMGGSLPPEEAQEKTDDIGIDVSSTFDGGVPMYIGDATKLATYVLEAMDAQRDAEFGAEGAELNKELVRKPYGSLQIQGADKCRLEVQNSEIEMGEDINITSGVFEQLGFVPNDHSPEPPPPLTDSEKAHLALAGAGIIPIYGNAASIADGVLYLKEGQIGAGLFSIACGLIPIAGNLAKGIKAGAMATKAGRVALKGAELAAKLDEAKKGMKLTKEIVSGAKYSLEYLKKLNSKDIASWLQKSVKGYADKIPYEIVAMQNATTGVKTLHIAKIEQTGSTASKVVKAGETGTKSAKTAQTAAGASNKAKTPIKDPINAVTGSLMIQMTDLSIKDLGGQFILKRNYESLYKNKAQPLGDRWLLSISGRLERKENEITILMDDHHKETFTKENGRWENQRGADRALFLTEEKDGYNLSSIKDQKTYTYNPNGYLTAITDTNANEQQIKYTGNHIEKIILANKKEIHFTYDKDKLTQITDPLGRTVHYRYKNDLLTQVTYPNDGTVTYQYTEEGWIEKITDQNANAYVKNTYDEKGRVIRQEMDKENESILFYQDQDKTTILTTPHNGQTIHYIYNRKNLVEKILYDDQTTEEKKYDEKENTIWEKDRLGNEIHTTYNENSQKIKQKHPSGLEETWAYDKTGKLTQENNNQGKEIRYTYDQNGNLTQEKSKINETQWKTKQWAYDTKGRKTAEIDENGNKTNYHYKENQSSPWQIITPENDTFTYQYDQAERTMAILTPHGKKEFAYNNIDHKTMEIDALENTTKYEYDKLGSLTKQIRPNQYDEKTGTGKGWQYHYDALDKETCKIDPLENVYATPRDAEENIIKEISPNEYNKETKDGKGIEYNYDKDNNKIKIHYPDGGTERRKYDANGNLIKKIQPQDYNEKTDDGLGYTYEYDAENRLTKITNAQGTVDKAYIYDKSGNITKEIDATGYLEGKTNEERPGTHYSYNALGWLTEKRVAIKKAENKIQYQVTQYKYDNVGNITEERRIMNAQDETSASGRVLSLHFSYDKQNRLKEVKDNTGAVVEYGYNCLNQKIHEKRKINQETYQSLKYHYDAAGRLEEISERMGKEGGGKFTANTKYTLDKTGNVIKITTPKGYTIERKYDEADRLIEEIHKDKENKIENKTEFGYDKAGNLIKTIDANGAAESYAYDLLNREIEHIGKNGGITRSEYDKNGNLVRKILPNENKNETEESTNQTEEKIAKGYRYTYDREGRITTVIAPDGTVIETNVYDQAGRKIQTLDATKSGVNYAYDLAGRITSIETKGGAKQAYEYDARGNITGIIDGNKNKTEYRLDKWGRITEIIKGDETKESYGYDFAGNLTETVDAEGNKIQYAYNLINKIGEITDQAGQKDEYRYDEEGRIKWHVDRNGNKVEYSYNIYGSLTEKVEQNSGLRETYEYHKDGSLKAAIAHGMRYGYEYYPDGRLKEKTASGKKLIQYAYDLNGNKIRQTDVTGKTTVYSYDEMDQLKKIRDEGQSIVEFKHNEDGTVKEAISANGMKTAYGYDADKNLSALAIHFNGQTITNNRYRYDGNGNRTEKEQLRGTTHYTYDSLNQLVKAEYPDCGEGLFYDKAGNRTRRIANGIEELYAYDERNRITRHEKQGIETSYEYDNAGNLINDGDKTYSYDGFNRTTKVETKDGQVQINRYDAEGLRYEIEENGKLVQFIFNEYKEVVLEKTDTNLKRLIRSFDLWASECTQEKTWYHYASDEQGSIVFVGDGEEIKNRYEYDAWGNAALCEETVENRYRYTGQQLDPVTQQYYLRARYYNPVIARFTQEDEYRGDGLNLYAYCANNPVVYYDPSGYAAQDGKDALGQGSDLQKADFYVMPSGQAVPSTGYRYMPENASYLDKLKETKIVPENPEGTYFTFDKYNIASPGKLQVPHDASVRGSFDTLQIIDDIKIPYGNWGKAGYLEPIVKDFPEYGSGGATQAITNSKIILDEITKLPK